MTTNDVMESKQLVVAKPSSQDSSLLSTTGNVNQNFYKPKIRVLIVDDLKLVCEGLQAIFADNQDIEIVGYALNGKDAVEQVSKIQPDVVVLDLVMPVMGGIEATKIIARQNPDVKILILSAFNKDSNDSVVSEIIAAGANGYVLKNMVMRELALAIRSVHSGSYHFAAELMDSLAKISVSDFNVNINAEEKESNLAPQKVSPVDSPVVTAKLPATKATAKKTKKAKPEKPLLPYADWALVVSGILVLSHIEGMGHDLGHIGLFLLMVALMARPMKAWWDIPLKYRRGVGVIAFAAALAHVIYATENFLEGNWATISLMSTQNKWGMWSGIISLTIMLPAAVTSFQFMQRKLGKAWRQIHLLSLPSMIFAVLHTVLVGPHYLMPDAQVEIVDYLRTFSVITVGILICLLRQRVIWSKLKLNDLGKSVEDRLKFVFNKLKSIKINV